MALKTITFRASEEIVANLDAIAGQLQTLNESSRPNRAAVPDSTPALR
jgi:hypothetical protein